MGGGESSSLHLCNDGAETSTGPSDVVLELSPKTVIRTDTHPARHY
jgi:hypothetical protein